MVRFKFSYLITIFSLYLLTPSILIAEPGAPKTGWGDIVFTYPGEPYTSIEVDMDRDGTPEYTEVNIYNSVLFEIQHKCCIPRKLDSIDCGSYMQVLMNESAEGKIEPTLLRIQYSEPGTDRTFTCQGKEITGVSQVNDSGF